MKKMNQNNPQLTILLSVYNQADTLDQCFKSIQAQTYHFYNIVCIDDASNDGSLEIIKRWQERFGKEKLLLIQNQTNLGLTKSLNKGLSDIKTSYTARIDADDLWQPDKLQKQMDFFSRNNTYGIIGCYYINFSKNQELKIKTPVTDTEIRRKMPIINPFAHSCIIFNTTLVKSVGGYNEALIYGQDYELWLKCYNRTKFYNIPEFLCKRKIAKKSYAKSKAHFLGNLSVRFSAIRHYHLSFHYYFPLIRDAVFFSLIIGFNKLKHSIRK